MESLPQRCAGCEKYEIPRGHSDPKTNLGNRWELSKANSRDKIINQMSTNNQLAKLAVDKLGGAQCVQPVRTQESRLWPPTWLKGPQTKGTDSSLGALFRPKSIFYFCVHCNLCWK